MAKMEQVRETLDGLPVIRMRYFVGHVQVPDVVVQAIARKFNPMFSEFDIVMAKLGYDSLNDYFYFTHAGMYIGVESSDGYMHT